MISNEIKLEVLNWIAEGCDWDKGMMLYSFYGKNKAFIKNITGKKATQSNKLIYELCKSVGLDYQKLKGNIKQSTPAASRPLPKAPSSMPFAPSSPLHSSHSSHPAPRPLLLAPGSPLHAPCSPPLAPRPEFIEVPESIETHRIEEYPAIIRRVIAEYAETYQERSKTHSIMTEMPEGNSQALKTKRAQLFDIVKFLTERLELLYDVQEVYKSTGFVPEESAIWPTPKEKAQTILPDDVDLLRKMKKNQQSANTKDQSLLDYQSEKQGKVKKPMPNGPKRMKIENRIKARLKMIEEIDYKLLKL